MRKKPPAKVDKDAGASRVHYRAEYESVDDFLDVLDPRRGHCAEEGWVFRGESDARWRLIPSALRSGAWLRLTGLEQIRPRARDLRDQLLNEVWAIAAFAREADRQGLPVPGYDGFTALDEREHDEMLKDLLRSSTATGLRFPPREWEPMFAMAQHYGISTRLLDWSESAYVAAYFAAVEAARRLRANPRLVRRRLRVWALDVNRVEELERSDRWGEIRAVRAPWATNPNLRAQKGSFTIHHQIYRRGPGLSMSWAEFVALPPEADDRIYKIPRPQPLDRAVSKLVESTPEWRHELLLETPLMRAYTLPWRDAPALLTALERYGVSAASLFPGYSGAARSILELRFRTPAIDTHSSGRGFAI